MKDHAFCRKCVVMRLTALVLWAAAILWLSLTPQPPQPPHGLSWDKLRHAAAYGLLTFLAGRAFILFFSRPHRGWLWAVGFSVGFGTVIELAQGLLSDVRKADPLDFLANACGAAAVYVLARLWPGMSEKRQGR